MENRLFSALLIIFLCLLGIIPILAANPEVPLGSWVYRSLRDLRDAGLIPDYPADWIAADHALTRCEIAMYIRAAFLSIGQGQFDTAEPMLQSKVEETIAKLNKEFEKELAAVGIQPIQQNAPVYLDLDEWMAQFGSGASGDARDPQNPNPPAKLPSGELANINTYLSSETTYDPYQAISMFYQSFQSVNLLSLAGEVLGFNSTLELSADGNKRVFGEQLRVGEFLIDENPGLLGSWNLSLSRQSNLNFNAMGFVDLDQAETAITRLTLDVHTRLDLTNRLDLYGRLSLDYEKPLTPAGDFASEANALLRFMVGDNLYFIAEYSLGVFPTNWRNASIGFGLGDIGLILLGIQTPILSDASGLELTGELIYQF